MALDTRTTLLDAAEHAARRRGYDGFSYGDLAQQIGIRKASVHYHFPNKSVLATTLVQRYFERFLRATEGFKAQHASAAGRLNATIDHYRAALEGGDCLCLCVAFSSGRDSLPPDAMDQVTSLRQAILEWLEAVFELAHLDGSIANLGDAGCEAQATLALLEGAQLAARAQNNLVPFDRAVQLLQDRL
ncbi:TetR/AcrR family transcriptional regulator [Algirhabdus cladophorae]|uniref:TetR/AcrR family transcriptional regulator n=1 Tax=Algirhabdus cladophorae TaxID=3377108 RepID=UPI003B847593